MVQGTASHAGKSTLVAALCRWFANRGVRVAPYKAQNMSLNAAVTPDGAEIGRAQMVQAIAARAVPRAEMNPVLLKPHAETCSQVVVLGRAEAVRSARAYFEQRDRLWPVVRDALDTLRREFDLVIAEGAGSPAEINLRDREIVNMRVARHAGAAVLLVGDIERGGVFASLAGTLALLEPEERALVRGFAINKFRGDVSLIEPGPAMLEARTGVPTVGVIPYFRDILLPEEDALGADPTDGAYAHAGAERAVLDVIVVALPHMANFDDFDPLRQRPGVAVRFVADAGRFGTPDLVILPGSKTTIADLQWLRETGLADRVRAHRARGGAVLGVCGGFQMLGRAIHDPDGIESPVPEAEGLGLLPHVTTFAPAKRTVQARATIVADRGPLASLAGHVVAGYEIHMGRSTGAHRPLAMIAGGGGGGGGGGPGGAGDAALGATDAANAALTARAADVHPDGGLDDEGLTMGTYLHGLLHDRALRETLLDALARRKGAVLPPPERERPLDGELDRLAAFVEAHLDLPRIAGWVGLA